MFLTTTRKLKIWTIFSHALIVVGAGHGILFFFLIEIVSFPYITKGDFELSFNSGANHFPVIGLITLLGQIFLIMSILSLRQILKNIFQVTGVLLLWLSIIYYIYDSTQDSYIHIAILTVVPFAVCTVITFCGYFLIKLYKWVIR